MKKIVLSFIICFFFLRPISAQYYFKIDSTNSPIHGIAPKSITSFGDSVFFTSSTNQVFKYDYVQWKTDTLPTINNYSPIALKILIGRDNKIYVITDTAIYVKIGSTWQIKMLLQSRFKYSTICPDKNGKLWFFDNLDSTKIFTFSNFLDSVIIPIGYRSLIYYYNNPNIFKYYYAIDDSFVFWYSGHNGLVKFNGSNFSCTNDNLCYRAMTIDNNNNLWTMCDSNINYSFLIKKSQTFTNNCFFTFQAFKYQCQIPIYNNKAHAFADGPMPSMYMLNRNYGYINIDTFIFPKPFTNNLFSDSITDLWVDFKGNYWFTDHQNFIKFLRFDKQNYIGGRVFFDQNTNGIKDNNEVFLQGVNVNLSPNNQNRYTNSTGYFEFLPFDTSGTYYVTATIPAPWYQTTNPISIPIIQTYMGQIDTTILIGMNSQPYFDVNLMGANNAFRSGSFGVYHLVVKNLGSIKMDSVLLTLDFDNSLIFSVSNPIQNSIIGNQIKWWIDSINPYEIKHLYSIFSVPVNNPIGTALQSKAWVYHQSDSNQINDTIWLNHQIMAPLDPNNKLHYIRNIENVCNPGDTIKYTINFQNCGNDTAFKVVLKDTLHNDFNVNTFKFLGSSHECTYTINSNRELVVTFLQCNLPDSTTNYYGSMGFFNYSIILNSNALIDSFITNTAHIYFDYNSAVVTNTSRVQVYKSTNGIPSDENSSTFNIAPNPVLNFLTIKSSTNISGSSFTIFDILGVKIEEGKLDSEFENTINVEKLSKGTYILEILSNENQKETIKFVK